MINLKEFIGVYAREQGITKELSKTICASVFDLLGRVIDEEDIVKVKGLGVFRKKVWTGREVCDPATKITKMIPDRISVVFKRVKSKSEIESDADPEE